MRASAFRWAPAESSGATSRKKRCVGLPSSELKSTPSALRPKAATTLRRPGSLPCGIATPSPSAVLFSRSRSSSACTRRLRSISGWCAVTDVASSAMMSSFEPPPRSATISAGSRTSVIRIGCSAALGLDQPVVPVVAPVEDAHGLARSVREHQELVARRVQLLDRLLDRQRLRGHPLRADDLGRSARPAPVGGEHGGGHGDRVVPARGVGALVVAALRLQLLRLVLQLVEREVDRG